jgi:ribosome-binding protein aMBF1 (putative translation factor)
VPQLQTSTDVRITGLARSSGSCARVLDLHATDPFDEHLAALPTLDDVIAQLRAKDPTLDDRLEAARRTRYRKLLEEASAGRISRITVERLRLGMTQAELAARAGMAQPNVSRLEKPGAAVSVGAARRLAGALGLADYRELLP